MTAGANALLDVAVTDFIDTELPGMRLAATIDRPISLAAIGTTADKPLRSPGLRRQLNESSLIVDRTNAYPDTASLMARQDWDIAVVLSPYKSLAAAVVGELSPAARESGVVDTIFRRAGRSLGVNTNTWAVSAVLRRLHGTNQPQSVLILGTGATAHSVVIAIRREWPSTRILIAERTPGRASAFADAVDEVIGADRVGTLRVDVVIQSTTWGETEKSEQQPFAFDLQSVLQPGVAFFDLNNRESALVRRALDVGCVVMTGNYMQAVTHACRAAGLRRWLDDE